MRGVLALGGAAGRSHGIVIRSEPDANHVVCRGLRKPGRDVDLPEKNEHLILDTFATCDRASIAPSVVCSRFAVAVAIFGARRADISLDTGDRFATAGGETGSGVLGDTRFPGDCFHVR